MHRGEALANLAVLATPGGIERQEREGQRQFVAAQQLPRKFNGHPDGRQVLEAFGFQFGEIIDELFIQATLPAGWEKRGSDHAMWSYVHDELGRQRLSIFYKAAFYDLDAFININRRFYISQYDSCTPTGELVEGEGETGFFAVSVRDWDKRVIFSAGHTGQHDWKAQDQLRDVAKAWLAENYPDWEKCTAYWELP